jgi:hypothetical protein
VPTAKVLSRRLASVKAQSDERRIDALIRRIATRLEVAPEDVRREAEELVRRFDEAGATTNEAKLAYIANELNMTPDDVLEELRNDPDTGHLW